MAMSAVVTPAVWLPHLIVGGMFTMVGLLKVYGLVFGIVGGWDKPYFQYACGTCPAWVGRSWKGRCLRYGLPALFLGIGLWNLWELARDLS